MIRILIADDHPIVRQGIKQIISGTSGMVVADEASTGQETLKKVIKNDYDVVVLDISMPKRSGLDILKELKESKPNLQILVLSMFPEEQYAIRVLKSGASGYLTKESASNELIKAIRKVAWGGKYITSSLAERLVSDLDKKTEKPIHETLSDREYQVMLMIASGKTPSEIADKLFLSIKTISTYRSRIIQKMGLKTNAEIIRYSIKTGLVD